MITNLPLLCCVSSVIWCRESLHWDEKEGNLAILQKKCPTNGPWDLSWKKNYNLSTSSLISPSFQSDPKIFHKGIFLKQTTHIKN